MELNCLVTLGKCQLSEAANYARKQGVILKGDLPIGVDRNSVDTWVYPNLFRMNTSTGAPPDYFDKNGQNWGFPTYNWEEMSKDNYAWWRGRLTQVYMLYLCCIFVLLPFYYIFSSHGDQFFYVSFTDGKILHCL